ncbi:hypothetical protein BU25DRAFT_483544 [Macroventuria anomochaeta]|uniref:Uncharacterized protein n=1 Tax=Macroventuria anomochaeta TaxID=301207 RepID=A0ACB6S9A3_9PLEO|nr:uncharacterized protein BU25DRAFT_483544 [Macroventuria anomochaeta]KAF2630781.1 hypothetical protein BU25DRAFT_483544 [Macroventuria anomochaeta]
MDRRRRASSATSKSLLNRQLASITDILAKASQRRDEEVKRSRRTSRVAPMATDLVSSSDPAAPILAGEPDHAHPEPPPAQLDGGAEDTEESAAAAKASEDEYAEIKRREMEKFHRVIAGYQAEVAVAKASKDDETERLRKEEVEFQQMVAGMEAEDARREEEEKRYAEDMGRKKAEEAAKIKAQEAPRRAEREAEAAKIARKNETSDTSIFDASMPSMRDGDASPNEDDPRAMLAELRNLEGITHKSENHYNDQDRDEGDIRRMLAELDKSASYQHSTTVTGYDDDPQQMVAELATLSVPHPRGTSSYTNENREDEEEDDDDASILRARLQNLRSSSNGYPQLPPDHVDSDRRVGYIEQADTKTVAATRLEPEVIPYIVALQLGHSNSQWEHVQGWTTCLYSSGLNSYEAQKGKEVAVAHAEDALNKIISSVMEVEEISRRKAEETKLQRRLIVSNLAAGADEEEIERQFWKHRYEM